MTFRESSAIGYMLSEPYKQFYVGDVVVDMLAFPPDHKSNFNPQTTPFLMGAIEVIFWVQFLKSSIAITSRT